MMSKKKFLKFLIFIVLLNFLFPYHNIKADERKALIIYDGYRAYGEEFNSLNEVIKTVVSFNYKADVINIESTESNSDISEYEKIIILKNKDTDIPKDIINKLKTYKDRILIIISSREISNLSDIKDSSSKFDDVSGLAVDFKKDKIQKDIFKFLTNENNDSYKQRTYLVLDEVYPFDDLNEIIKKIDYLYELGIPFIISAMPIFNNTDLGAMQKYAEVLRYAEAKGGVIILHFPSIYKDKIININMDELINKMTIAYTSFINYFVYPRAIDIPEDFIYHNRINDYLKFSNTLFLTENEEKITLSNNNFTVSSFNTVVEKIAYEKFNKDIKYNGNIGISITGNIEFNDFKRILEDLDRNQVYFNNFSYVDSNLSIEGNTISSKEGLLYLNNKNVTVQKFISRDEFKSMFEQEKSEVDNSSMNLSFTNRFIVVITVIASFIFIIIVIRSRKIDRNKFFK